MFPGFPDPRRHPRPDSCGQPEVASRNALANTLGRPSTLSNGTQMPSAFGRRGRSAIICVRARGGGVRAAERRELGVGVGLRYFVARVALVALKVSVYWRVQQ